MELVLKTLVVLVQRALGGFVRWGGWLCFREWLRADGAPAVAAAPAADCAALHAAVKERYAALEREAQAREADSATAAPAFE